LGGSAATNLPYLKLKHGGALLRRVSVKFMINDLA